MNDLRNHEAPVCVGIFLNRNLGEVIVRNNTIRNMSSKGILSADNWESSDVKILDNEVISEVYGAYSYNQNVAGVGIHVQGSWSEPRSGGKVLVKGNKVKSSKLNYGGIAVHGPSNYREGSGKLENCIIEYNVIELNKGYFGLQIRKSDKTEIKSNKILGSAYYGIIIGGKENITNFDLWSNRNVVKDNNMDDLTILKPDYYSHANADGKNFAGYYGNSVTKNVWLQEKSRENLVVVKKGITVLDEGMENSIEYID